MRVYILRGVPGCGKTTYARRLQESNPEGTVIISADNYFMRDGVYRFDPSQLHTAHNECLRAYAEYVTRGNSPGREIESLIVDNTNLSVAEIAPYYALALAYGHRDVAVYNVNRRATADECYARNAHGVSLDTFCRMANTFADNHHRFPPWWATADVTV